ncbi:predicted protein, partial [Nematostella vectensis]
MAEQEISTPTSQTFGWLAFRPECLKFLNSPKWFLFFLVMYFFTQSIVVNGVYSVSISTIEKRYGYSSSLTGFLTSSFDIAALVLTPLVSFLGARRKKPVWCGVGLLTMGIGMLIFFLPHAISKRYEAVQMERLTGLCNSTSGSLNPCESTSGNKGYFPLFVLGMLVMGSGATPMIALGIPYMDENVKAKVSPMYVGIFYASGIFGAGAGFVVAGIFLAMYVDIGVQTSLTPKDERWVGAWWLGFVVCGTLCIFWSLWLFGFPRRIPKKNASEDLKLTESDESAVSPALVKEVSHLPLATKSLLSNVTYVSATIACCLEAFVISGFVAFAPKILQSQFRLPAARVSILYGLLAIPAALCGNLLGSYINKKLRLSMTGAALMCLIVTFLGAGGTFPLLASCSTVTMAGINTQGSTNSYPAFLNSYASCNADCACSSLPYSPICSGGVTYYSSCHAGCRARDVNGSLADCSCLSPADGVLKDGKCRSPCGYNNSAIMAGVFLFGFLTFMTMTPTTIVTLRCLPWKDRTYGMGFQMTTVRLLGSIPGPIVYGALIDRACILWDTRCDGQGNCLEYNNTQLAYTVFGLCFVCKLVVIMGFLVSYL